MRIYRDLELVEQLGSGIPRILKAYDRSCFKFFPNFIRMTFPKLTGGQASGQAGGQAHKTMLTERQKEVFELIKQSPDISRRQLALKLGINESAIQKHIDALKQKRAIVREGETTGFWKIIMNTD